MRYKESEFLKKIKEAVVTPSLKPSRIESY